MYCDQVSGKILWSDGHFILNTLIEIFKHKS